jgi:hypothetical protein
MPRKKQAAEVAQRQSVNNLIVVSDLHVGCQLALCSPDNPHMDEGGGYAVSKVQRVVWDWWQEFWNEWVPHVTHGEPYGVVINGDLLDGSHHGSTHQWSHNITDQRREAQRILEPIAETCRGRFFVVRGTEAHAGKSMQDEEELAHNLGAVPNEAGQYARHELWIRVGRALCHFAHHIGTAGSMAYESSAVMRELSEAFVEAGVWDNQPPDVLVRSHRHRHIEIRRQTKRGFVTAFVTPAWQLKTPFAYKVAGARQSQPQIGGSLIRCGDEDVFTRHFVKALSRPPEVTL